MTLQVNLLTGLMLGIEYVDLPEMDEQHVVIDILFLRIVFSW